MKRKILIVLTLFIGAITQAQTIQPANLNGTGSGKSIELTFIPKGDVIHVNYSLSSGGDNPMESLSLNFLRNTRTQIILENTLVCNIVNSATGVSTTLNAAGRDKFSIPNDLPAGSYNFKLNGRLIATNYKVK